MLGSFRIGRVGSAKYLGAGHQQKLEEYLCMRSFECSNIELTSQ